MNARRQVFRIAQVLCLLLIASVWAEQDFKEDFGAKFGAALKQYNAELMQSNMDGLKKFYQTAIGDFDLGPQDERAFRMRLDSIDVIKRRIGETVTPESVKATSNFSKLVIFELLMFRASPAIVGDSAKSAAFDEAMKTCAEGETNNVSEFIEKMLAKWKELYATIPSEELEKHAEYEDINGSIENLAKMDGSLSNVLGRTLALVESLRKLSNFFDYSEWNMLLLKNKL